MNEVEKVLYRSRMSLREACEEVSVDFDTVVIEYLQECTSCGIWERHSSIIQDLDDNPVCLNCCEYYGL